MLQLCGVLELVWWHTGRARLRPRRRSPCRQPAATNTGAAQWDSQMVATLHCTVLYCSVLYCTVLYCTVQYCTLYFSTFDYNAWKKMVADSLVTMKWPRWPSFESERRVATEEIYDLSYTAWEAQTLLPPSPDAVVSTVTTISCLLCSTQSVSAPLGAGTISPEAAYLQIILAANIFIWKIFVYLRKIFLPH